MDEKQFKIQNRFIAILQILSMANSNATQEALKCTASIAADSIVDAINFITGILFSDQKTSFSQIRFWLRPNLSSEILPNSASAEFEKVKFGATLFVIVEAVSPQAACPNSSIRTLYVHVFSSCCFTVLYMFCKNKFCKNSSHLRYFVQYTDASITTMV